MKPFLFLYREVLNFFELASLIENKPFVSYPNWKFYLVLMSMIGGI